MMKRRSTWSWVALTLFVLAPLVFLASLAAGTAGVARGKSAALSLADEMDAQQQLAQELALADPRVQALTNGHRSEVFGVQALLGQWTDAARACATADCRQVNLYNWDEAATVVALVNLDRRAVLDVLHQPGTRPGIPARLADRALAIALNAPQVVDVIGQQPTNSDWAPMDSTLVGSVCEQGHLCVAPTFDLGDYILWAIVDLTDERFVDLFWTATDGVEEGERGNPHPYPEASGCPAPGVVTRGGWVVNYNTTGTDGFRVHGVTYNGTPVLTSAKLAEWHADYGSSGFQDSTGCGGGGGGFPIYPYGDTETRELLDAQNNVIGFEVVQDFRMNNWGNSCNYRYDQHFQFFNDGRWRVVAGAYGKGCGTNSLYRPLLRIDVAVNGDAGDSVDVWSGSGWADVGTETRYAPPNATSPEGYGWRVMDSGGSGYYIEPGRAQFHDGGRGDNEFIYFVQHHPNEGDTDLGVFSAGCCNDNSHGPEIYVNSESVADQNVVIWYVPQMQTEVAAGNYYCWTVQGEPNPVTYPCFAGPMFVPVASVQQPEASFIIGDGSGDPVPLGQPVQFTNTSTGGGTLTYQWNFGDGSTSTEQNPTHTYNQAGSYTVTLTVTNEAGSDSATGVVQVFPPTAVTLSDFSASQGEMPLLAIWGLGSLLAMAIAVTRIHSMRRQL